MIEIFLFSKGEVGPASFCVLYTRSKINLKELENQISNSIFWPPFSILEEIIDHILWALNRSILSLDQCEELTKISAFSKGLVKSLKRRCHHTKQPNQRFFSQKVFNFNQEFPFFWIKPIHGLNFVDSGQLFKIYYLSLFYSLVSILDAFLIIFQTETAIKKSQISAWFPSRQQNGDVQFTR